MPRPTTKNRKPLVVTHSGAFHPDDVLAVSIITLALGRPVRIMRSRDPRVWAKADYIFDVGGVYDPKKNRFDHHQAGFRFKRKNGIMYSSAGLAWKHFGMQVAKSRAVWEIVERRIIEPLDAEDNGIELYKPIIDGVYQFSFFDYIFAFNPTRQEKTTHLAAFKKAVREGMKMLSREIERISGSIANDEKIKAIYRRAKDKRVIVLDGEYSYKHVLEKFKEPLFVISPRSDDGSWGIKALRKDGSKFANRLDLPKSWAAKTGAELQKITGVADAVFCHRGRFIAVAKSKAGAIALAERALKEHHLTSWHS